jgi:vancomycin resistance protein YoaR
MKKSAAHLKKLLKKVWFYPVVAILSLLIVSTTTLAYGLYYYQDKMFPNIKISSLDVSGKTPAETHNQITEEFKLRNKPIEVNNQQKSFTIDPTLASPKINSSETVKKAFSIGRSGDYFRDFKDIARTFLVGTDLKLELSYANTQSLFSQIEAINQALKQDPTPAVINQATFEITPSKDGVELDKAKVFNQINDYLSLNSLLPKTLTVKTATPYFNTQKAEIAKTALQSVKQTGIKLSYQKNAWTLNQTNLYTLINTTGENGDSFLDSEELEDYLQPIAGIIFQPVKNARFNLDTTTKKVTEFQQAENGQELDLDQTKNLITQAALDKSPHEITLPVKITAPSISSSDATDFGIEELVAQGVSHFAGSIENRIYNVGLAASRINGVLLAPNETFSFDNTIGDISGATGYKQAYVIKSGRTVLDDGGGVCQVSTTLFRAVLNAGLPVVARTAHAYRVGYYEQGFPPGMDATIFYPSVDFKFKNDTGKYLLIQTKVVGTSLYIDLYGKKDGREVTLTKPVVTNIKPAPPEIRQDDPTLPKGVVKQVDFAASGATVYFKRTVTRSGQTLIDEGYTSVYRPWQAVFLVGTM